MAESSLKATEQIGRTAESQYKRCDRLEKSLLQSRQLLWRRGDVELLRGSGLSLGSEEIETCYVVSAPGRETLVFSVLLEACAYFWEITAECNPGQPVGHDEMQSMNRRQ